MKRAGLLFLLTGCGPAVLDSSSGDASGDSSSSSSVAEASAGEGSAFDDTSATSDGTSIGPGGSSGSVSGGEASVGEGSFFPPDPPETTCDPFQQDCPEGEKCLAHAERGGSWDAVGCFPVVPNPGQPGDPCTMQESPYSGLDDCDVGAMCWEVDPGTLQGTCVALCTGSLQQPVCAEPAARCVMASNIELAVCLDTCDPLLQDCNEGFVCHGFDGDFVCVSDEVPDPVPEGGACEFENACTPGAACIPASTYGPSCEGSACCSMYCDTTDPDCPNPDHGCVGLDDLPLGLEWLGLCQLPQ